VDAYRTELRLGPPAAERSFIETRIGPVGEPGGSHLSV
jgi:hypothetical protein